MPSNLPVYLGYAYFHINKISSYLSKQKESCQCSAVWFRFLCIQLYYRLESLRPSSVQFTLYVEPVCLSTISVS